MVTDEEFLADPTTHREAHARGRKIVVAIRSAELSRARGGPRCMTMPLVRDAV